MKSTFLISDAARQVSVEAHVLRYWEEELKLPIKRNELGHRYYTEEDIQRFMEIKNLKERGLQLKAIRMILKNGKLDRLTEADGLAETAGQETEIKEKEEKQEKQDSLRVVSEGETLHTENSEDKMKRLQWLLQQMMKEVVKENNASLCREMKDSILKELDYQFRMQEEKEEERNAQKLKRDEEYYKRIDELLRKKRKLFKK